ncbi:hypothetical protein R1sor_016117 [Riccia sorocarpa]|uniref:GRF-type domain-containing protein n=1 Tax=Riccia sorocarpa TaxID=122646 RepID=A0ABD3HE25_9MARC
MWHILQEQGFQTFTGDLHVLMAEKFGEDSDKFVEVAGDSADRALHTGGDALNFSDKPHSIMVEEGSRVLIEEVRKVPVEASFCSVNLPPETLLEADVTTPVVSVPVVAQKVPAESSSCSVDLGVEIFPGTRYSVAEVNIPGDSFQAAALREERDAMFYGSRSPEKCSADETSHGGHLAASCMNSAISLERRLSGSAHDALPVAIRTLPLVPYREVAHEQGIDGTILISYPFHDREAQPNNTVSSKDLIGYQEGECASGNALPVGKSKSVSELESWDRLGVVLGADSSVLADMALPRVEAKDFTNTTTALVDSGEAAHDQQLMVSQGDSFGADSVENEIAVKVKKKLQTKRKKVVDHNMEAKKKETQLPALEPVLVSSRLGDAACTRDSSAVVENTETHDIQDVTTLNATGWVSIPASCESVDVGMSKADSVEGIPITVTGGDQTHGHYLMCNCGKPAVLKTVGYKSRNRGLRYYSCENYKPTFFTKKRNRKHEFQNLLSCRFFQWLDTPRMTVEDKTDIKLRKKRQLEHILATKAATTYYSSPSSSKLEPLEHEAEKNQEVPEGVTPVSGLSEDPKQENSEEPKSSRKKQKLNKVDPLLPDCVAFSTRASAARKRKGPCVSDDENIRGGSSSCGESSHEGSGGDWTDSHPGKVAKSGKGEGLKKDAPAHTYSRRAKSSGHLGLCAIRPRPKSVGKLERATADTNHVRKLLPVSLAYQKSREVVLDEISRGEGIGDYEEASSEEGNFRDESSSEEECVETPSSISVERIHTDITSQGRGAYSETRSVTRAKFSGKPEDSIQTMSAVREDANSTETSLAGILEGNRNRQPQWLDVPLTCPFEQRSAGRPGASGHQAAKYRVDRSGKFSSDHGVIVNFPTPSQVGERRTVSGNTLLIVKEKAREASLAVGLRKRKYLRRNVGSQALVRVKPTNELEKSSDRGHFSDSDNEETGPKGYRGLRSLKEMLSRENSDGTVADYEVPDELHPPFCECKTARRRAVLKTVVANSPNQGLRYWVCVNHRPLYRKKRLWEGDTEDETCKFFRWLDIPVVSNAESKKKLAGRRGRNGNVRPLLSGYLQNLRF